ncbi:MAPEG family protein [Sphingoaurantiacus capsulatus]|uniref:MAPEG family protein n=1 Tax=Sphingoaurantiacus capsulatus TaxID=1771310 RepID=A0ABV7XFW3_9SPHN
MQSPILAPVVALIIWSLVMLVWAVFTRLPALKAAGVDMSKARGGRPGQLDGVLPDETQWKAHNYNHLMEQPTLFYAVALTLAVLGAGGGLNAQLAWAYVGLRVLHSLIQATSNVIRFRFLVFALATLALLALTVHAAIIVF